jgi:hypothetical protein
VSETTDAGIATANFANLMFRSPQKTHEPLRSA